MTINNNENIHIKCMSARQGKDVKENKGEYIKKLDGFLR